VPPTNQVRFVTAQERYRVPDAPIAVPVTLRRYGLSEIINHLLGFGTEARLRPGAAHLLLVLTPLQKAASVPPTEKPVPFEFFINGQILRTTLQAFFEANNTSTVQTRIRRRTRRGLLTD